MNIWLGLSGTCSPGKERAQVPVSAQQDGDSCGKRDFSLVQYLFGLHLFSVTISEPQLTATEGKKTISKGREGTNKALENFMHLKPPEGELIACFFHSFLKYLLWLGFY